MIVTLIARDDIGRKLAVVDFKLGWRWNAITEKRENVWRPIGGSHGYGYDFGTIPEHLILPIGQSHGIIPSGGLKWTLA